ncbi:MAG: hypothetical protein ACKV19_12970 [Verrucomicrobiales bacterium]
MKLLCVDEDTSEKVGLAIRKLRPTWDVLHARQWAGGGTPDDLLLEMLWQDRRALISRDRSTLPGWIKRRQARSLDHAGVFFWDAEKFPPDAIGALARACVRTMERFSDTVNVVDTIR